MIEQLLHYAPLISASAIVISAVTASSVFVYTRRVNRRRATLDMVMRTFLDEKGAQLYDRFKTLVRRNQDPDDDFTLVSLVEHNAANEQNRNTIIDQLNSYELVSLGIRQGLFDEKFYKLWFHRQFTRDFRHVAALIAEIRKKRPSTYCEFAALDARWQRNRHPLNQPSKFKLAWWALTGNYRKLDTARIAMSG